MRVMRSMDYTTLPEIKVKGHKLNPRLRLKDGTFHAVCEDGTEIEAVTLKELKDKLSSYLQAAAKEVRPAVKCYMLESHSIDSKANPAEYVGKRKGSTNSHWSSNLMFDVYSGGSREKKVRENLGWSSVRERVLSPKLDLKELAKLTDAYHQASKRLSSFLKKNAFNPTGEDLE